MSRLRLFHSRSAFLRKYTRIGLQSCSLIALSAILLGCSGSSGNKTAVSGIENEGTYGSFITRAVGTAQSPVISAGRGAAIYGIAGASFTDITQTVTESGQYVPPATDRIAFIKNEDLHVMSSTGSDIKQLTSTNVSFEESEPSISPDGTKIAFERDRDIFIINTDGTGLRNLTNSNEREFQPTWSPDGTKIAFISDRAGSGYDIWTIKAADGSDLKNITNSNNVDEFHPDWSTKGKIAFVKQEDIYVMNADGTSVTQLTSTNVSIEEDRPAFSPDGSKIAFTRDYDIWLVNVTGGNPTNITNSTVREYFPTWSADGKKLAYTGDGSGSLNIWTMNVDGTGAKDITPTSSHDDLVPDWSPAAANVNPVTPPITRKLVGTGGILASSCAGFLFGQLDKAVTSVVTFDTPSIAVAARSAARVQALTSPETNSYNLIFSITGGDGGLGGVRYVNGSNKSTALTFSSAAGAIVTFSVTDGTVTTVVPYTATKSVGQSSLRTETDGNAVVVRGRFPSVWDKNGVNIAPDGAKAIRLNPATGELLGVE